MGLNKTFQELNLLYQEYPEVLLNPRPLRKGSELLWEGFGRRHLPKNITIDVLAQLQSSRNYSYQHADGSVFQLYYRFSDSGDLLLEAHLAFYKNIEPAMSDPPQPLITEAELNSESSGGEGLATTTSPLCPWVRIDFDPDDSRMVTHSACHVHLAHFNDTRVACKRVPSPRQFVDAMMAWFYPTWYEDERVKPAAHSGRVWTRLCTSVLRQSAPATTFIPGLHLNL